jgi:putative flavoprotein involved in K+ transport
VTESTDLVVIGAGPGGLCVAAAARAAGLEAVVLERGSRIGGVWHQVEADLLCLSPRQRDRLPDGTTPRGEGVRARADEVLRALEEFVDREQPDIRFGRSATRLARGEDGLELSTEVGAIHAPRVVLATGEYGRPRVPGLPGSFAGPAQHTSEIREADIGDGERVVIVGSGNSAVDLASRLLQRGIPLWISARSGIAAAATLPGEPLSTLLWWASALPISALPASLGCSATVPKVDDDLRTAAADGRLSVVGETVGLESGAILVAGGERVEVDRIVWATGFRRDLQWVHGITLDDDGAPAHDRGLSTEVPGLAFMGLPCMRNRRSGFLRGFAADARSIVARLR